MRFTPREKTRLVSYLISLCVEWQQIIVEFVTSVIFSACLSLNTGATPLPETFKTIIKLYKVWNIQFFVLFCFVLFFVFLILFAIKSSV